MRQLRLPQPDLFKTAPHKLTPSQRLTTAVALLKVLLLEAISAQTSAATDDAELSLAIGNSGVEIEECAGNDQNNA
jgi:hypothetical protein